MNILLEPYHLSKVENADCYRMFLNHGVSCGFILKPNCGKYAIPSKNYIVNMLYRHGSYYLTIEDEIAGKVTIQEAFAQDEKDLIFPYDGTSWVFVAVKDSYHFDFENTHAKWVEIEKSITNAMIEEYEAVQIKFNFE